MNTIMIIIILTGFIARENMLTDGCNAFYISLEK